MPSFYIWSVADLGQSSLFDIFNGTFTVTGTPDVVQMSDGDASFDDFFGNGGQTRDPGMDQDLTSDLVVDGVTLGITGDGIYNAAEGTITNQTTGETGRILYITVNGGSVSNFVGFATTVELNPGDTVQTSSLSPLATEDYVDIIACFTAGTRIECADGPRAVESLKPGDRVWTVDNGLQELRWIGETELTPAALAARPELRPIHFPAGSLGGGLPLRDMSLSPNHRLLQDGSKVALNFGCDEVLVPAKAMLAYDGIAAQTPSEGVRYLHLMFDQHELIWGDGVVSESFHPACMEQNSADAEVREELFALFPELAQNLETYGPLARPALRVKEAQVLAA